MLYGDSSFNFTSISITFNISDINTANQFIDQWNQTLSAPTTNYSAYSEALKQLWASNAVIYSSSSISNLSGTFTGAVASVNSAAIYKGVFTTQNATFTNVDYSTVGRFANDSHFYFSGISGLSISNQQLTFTSQEGLLQFSSLNITQAQLGSLATSSGSVSFSGTCNYAVAFIPAPLDATKLLPYIIPIVLVTAAVGLIALRMGLRRSQNGQRDIQLNGLGNPDARADRFLSNFPPSSQAAHLALNADNATPPTVSDQDHGASMLLIRNFDGFDFTGVKPTVKIGKMENGEQEIEFVAYQECSIQSNACLKPRLFGSEQLQPPPSFDTFGASLECYYEVKIISKDKENAVMAFGFATCPYPPFRLPGKDSTSIAYHSDSGNVFLNNRESGTLCGTPISVGDTLGIGYRIVDLPSYGNHILNQTVFYFTHNGIRIGDEFVTDGFYPDQIYPTIGTTGSCKLQLSFGPTDLVFNSPTVFQVDDTIVEVDLEHPTDQATAAGSVREVEELPLNSVSPSDPTNTSTQEAQNGIFEGPESDTVQVQVDEHGEISVITSNSKENPSINASEANNDNLDNLTSSMINHTENDKQVESSQIVLKLQTE
ncbi:Rsp5p-dependent ubiquitination, sorting of cargo proteins at the multivesicular body [Boothiomyces macroporosus]|uniref:Rsp5p-dependent ubiquitination, sorting of cargo proteins at the multivesicular body n=1 Tax=Boothiomyces macroporosus TaxID=261099 RepID=A0AAD5UEW5_9FUNG|nr:Rsp5p-dependent ubiquitination, sorting of cargo proteins at the multivesicular body [Boothiomyces macroporosus]